jgi:hypothetical protein
VASSYLLQLFFDFGQTFFAFFDDLVPLKLKNFRFYDSFGSFATPRFSFCLVPGKLETTENILRQPRPRNSKRPKIFYDSLDQEIGNDRKYFTTA